MLGVGLNSAVFSPASHGFTGGRAAFRAAASASSLSSSRMMGAGITQIPYATLPKPRALCIPFSAQLPGLLCTEKRAAVHYRLRCDLAASLPVAGRVLRDSEDAGQPDSSNKFLCHGHRLRKILAPDVTMA